MWPQCSCRPIVILQPALFPGSKNWGLLAGGPSEAPDRYESSSYIFVTVMSTQFLRTEHLEEPTGGRDPKLLSEQQVEVKGQAPVLTRCAHQMCCQSFVARRDRLAERDTGSITHCLPKYGAHADLICYSSTLEIWNTYIPVVFNP